MLLQQGGGTQVLPNFGDSLLFMHTPVDAAVSQPQEGRVPTPVLGSNMLHVTLLQ